MPATTPIQKAAFNAIDTLHFNQVVMSEVCKDPIAEWYPRIIIKINNMLREVGITGKQAAIAKHYLLGALEIYLSVDGKLSSAMAEYAEQSDTNTLFEEGTIYDKSIQTASNFSLTMLYAAAENNGVQGEFIDRAVEELVNDQDLDLSATPYLIRYHLVECCYALEYAKAPLGFYRELVSLGIISCGKYSLNIDTYAKKSELGLSLLFLRAGLLFEFKMLQRAVAVMISLKNNNTIALPSPDPRMSSLDQKHISDYYKRLVDDWFMGEGRRSFMSFQCKGDISIRNVEVFLENMNKYYLHKRMFSGTQGSWLGTLGAFDIACEHDEEPEMAIYYEENNTRTISEKIRLKYLEYGFSVSARSLYLRYKSVKKERYSQMRYYCFLLLNQNFITPWHLDKNKYYDMALSFDSTEIDE
ncbi:hypothetical protein [Enterobacter hormaechei]|uniref:hypothetical protein n=1 Tax=Enterobacter hormaechei TaxID=158836 RepID=UPI002236AF10|nr:hypothetical protein [Enterobacter hormaechei]MCW4896327.1 hypothetical protein [Enterobacter hormaechei subsp. xiangfangensis]MCW4947810.1 hypothetical protein [Enterobacter hormaechei subsp. xiangfangensis]